MQTVSSFISQLPWYLQAFGVGCLVGLGLILPWTAPLTVIGIIWAFWWLQRLPRTLTQVFLFGLIVWTAKNLITSSFLLSLYPVDWLNVEVRHSLQLLYIMSHWLGQSLWGGVAGGLVWVVYRFVFNYEWTYKTAKFILVAGVWVLGEVFGSILFSIFVLGPATTINPYFSLGYVGYALAAIPGFIPFMLVGGVYGLSFLVVLIAQIILSLKKFHWWFVFLPVIKLSIINIIVYYFIAYEPQQIRVAVVETAFPTKTELTSGELPQQTQAFGELIEAVAQTDEPIRYVILPEDARFSYYSAFATTTNETLFGRLRLNTNKTIFIDSTITRGSQAPLVLQAQYQRSGEIIAVQEKQLLIPQGEAISYITWSAIKALGGKDWLRDDGWGLVQPGTYTSPTNREGMTVDSLPPVLFCFESLNPLAVRQLMKSMDAPFITHIVSHASFHNAPFLAHQLAMMLRTQSVWNKVPIVQATNMGSGIIFYPDGSIIYPGLDVEGEKWGVSFITL